MSENNADFEKADIIISDALAKFVKEGISPYVYGVALMEIGIAALAKLGEDETSIAEQAKTLAARMKSGSDCT